TGKQTRPAQARTLRAMGIDFRLRPDGEIIVVDTDLSLRESTPRKPETFTLNG
ncbi:MAG: hypothetical protein ACI9FD_003808, partial [Gammaproteobacteria bacterium]